MKNAEDSRRLSDVSQRDTGESSRRISQDRARLSEQDASRTPVINVHDKENVMSLFEDKLEVKVVNVAMTLSMSSVTGLADLAEDEIIPKPIPMQVCIFAISSIILLDTTNSFHQRYTVSVYCKPALLFQIHLENISLRLNEDRPPNNITSPGPIPIDLNISKLRVARDASGVFHIEPVGK